MDTEGEGVPSYLQPDKEPDLDAELNLPAAPAGHAPTPAGNPQVKSNDVWHRNHLLSTHTYTCISIICYKF